MIFMKWCEPFFKLVKHRLACAAVVHAAELVQHGVLVLRGRGVRLRSSPIYGHMMVLEMLGLVVRMQMCVWVRAGHERVSSSKRAIPVHFFSSALIRSTT